jgi:UMF1 family MFS transporter
MQSRPQDQQIGAPPGALDRTVVTWALYDVATSAWIAAVPTLLYAIHFRTVIVDDPARADAAWGLTVAAALVIAGVAAPWVGARVDAGGSRTGWLVAATVLCLGATATMGFVGHGQVLLGAAALIAAQVGYTVGMALYDAYLPRISRPVDAPRVSSFGWAVGFVGGILSVLMCIALLQDTPSSSGAAFSTAFVAVAILMGSLAIPAILGLRRIDVASASAAPDNERGPSRPVVASAHGSHGPRNTVKFLAAVYLINDAIVTIAFFAVVYLRDQFGLGLVDLLKLALLYQCLAIPGTLLFGRLARRFSTQHAIYMSLVVWTAALLLMAFGSGLYVAMAVVALFALVLGSTQALLRGAYVTLVPPRRAGRYFGFHALAGRLSAATGPLVYALVGAATGSPQAALLSMLVFLFAGAMLLAAVRLEPARAPATPHAAS